ncbi:hypothetical protein CNR22_13760 [Sphingobacteriaceae bacterium]|nr:hypothetical protein CNR22_13760 [Sphingobacteriaceae bacterium]
MRTNSNLIIYFVVISFIMSCDAQTKQEAISDAKSANSVISTVELDPELQVSQYIRRMHRDKKGNLWFGTNGDGLAMYNGDTLVYFTMKDGLGGSAVRGFVEDKNGDIWLATDGGVSRYNVQHASGACVMNRCKHDLTHESEEKEHAKERAKLFTNFTMMHGLANNQVWSILQDKKGDFWFGTENGVSHYDHKTFTKFKLPVPDLKNFPDAYPSPALVNYIFEDKAGDIWFATNGGGVYRYDTRLMDSTGRGAFLSNLSEKDGLCNNFVQCIHQDEQGNFWFGTRFGGISYYDVKSFPVNKTYFNTYTLNFKVPEGLSRNFIWTFFEDSKQRLWVGTAGGGIYRYEGTPNAMGVKRFKNFNEHVELPNRFIQSFMEDKNGTLWIGSSGGLFRYDEERNLFINVTKKGPWK